MVSWKYGFESLLILLETRGIHIGHVVREDLHPTFMGVGFLKYRHRKGFDIPATACCRWTINVGW